MPRENVRQHPRRNPRGGTTTVRQHGRTGRGRKGKKLLTFGHAWDLFKKAVKAGRQNKKATFALFAGAALGEAGMVAAVRLGSVALGTAAVLALGVAVGGLMLSGVGR